MTEHSPNDLFHASSFLQGHNAEYVEQLYARFAADPASVDAAWAEFFAALGDSELEVKAEATGPSWQRADWPPQPGGEIYGALNSQLSDAPDAVARHLGQRIDVEGRLLIRMGGV